MAPKLSIADVLTLPKSTVKIPRLGFGVYKSPTNQCEESCINAIRAGYRHIDTAQLYGNEAEVGHAVRKCGIDRKELFLTTKILTPGDTPEETYKKALESVRKIDGEEGYVDLFLVHSTGSGAEGRKDMWLALERLFAEGKTRAIGVSNYGVKHMEEMKAYAKTWPPHVNQIELHPWCQQKTAAAYCKEHGIILEAFCPLVRNKKASNTVLVNLANKYGKTTCQILIRYSLQKDWVPLPKSDNPDRIKANAEVFDFDITDDDMAVLDGLDEEAGGAIVKFVGNE
ncbi:aldo-keto reductase [Arthroderma uncinatum]|uniref:aldo-keto reductase n=1 Tax=Arthroderma uncinatum TaxID=74035 RepID=UPI00144A64CF|nr:aldo-keto reductase [Arthroderma uncinatum]KAF3479847.1 aldo-keto reductase [Arthroderma uncinatum]